MTPNKYYNDFSTWIREKLPFKVQKISIDAGFSCPNRDGKVGTGGCIFCDNNTFNPSYCNPKKTVSEQLAEGKEFFGAKYPDMKYLAYFQAYSNTYGNVHRLRELYEEALAVEDVAGLVIGTRPDCLSEDVFMLLEELSHRTFLILELGVESTNNDTLRLINRGHDFECSRYAIEEAHQRGITTCAHMILGLPGEDEETCLRQADIMSRLPVDIIKLHQMQVIRGTKLSSMYEKEPFRVYSVDEYIDLVIKYIARLRKDIVLERFVSQSPSSLLIAPKWGIKNHEFTDRLNKRFRELSKTMPVGQGTMYSD